MQRQQTGGRTKAVLFLFASLLVAGLTAFIVLQVLQQSREKLAEANKPPDTVTVVIAARDLYMGLPITAEDVVEKALLPDMVPADLVYPSVDEVIGRTPRERILANEILRVERMARRDAGVGLNAIITPGKRAMTIEVDGQSGLGGFLAPGNMVDVIVTIRPDDKAIKAKWVTETILQDIKVLAVGDSLESRSSTSEDKSKRKNTRRRRPSVTLELKLDESEKLALASSRGEIHLVLRSDVDMNQEDTDGVLNTSALIGWEPPAVAAKATAPSRATPATTAEVIEGGDSTTVGFDSQGNKIESGDTNRRRNR